MIAFKDIQTRAKDLIAAHAYFAGENVIKDQGLSDSTIEKALRERGVCVVVPPVLAGRITSDVDQGCKISIAECEVFIQILLNPKINTDVAQKDIYLGISSIIAAMMAPNPVNPADRFQLFVSSRIPAIQLSSFDPGLWAYDLTFTKNAVL